VKYDGAYSPNISVFSFAPCLAGKKKLDVSSRLDVVEIGHVT